MHKPHHPSPALVVSLVCLSFLLGGLPSSVSAQKSGPSPEAARGVELYQQGDAEGAIKLLKKVVKKQPDDAYAWYYLGLSYNSQGLIAAARPAFQRTVELWRDSADAHAKLAYALILADKPEMAITMAQRAIELGDQSPEAHYALAEANLRRRADILQPRQLDLAVNEAEAALRINPDFAPALITKAVALSHLSREPEAVASLEQFLGVRPDDLDAEAWRSQLEIWKAAVNRDKTPRTAIPTVLNGKMVTQKARVLSKPEPSYTEAARLAGVEGTVVLRAIFTSDGEVKNLYVVQGLGFGLTTRSLEAARRIKFKPALKDDIPVSMYIQLEYNFKLY